MNARIFAGSEMLFRVAGTSGEEVIFKLVDIGRGGVGIMFRTISQLNLGILSFAVFLAFSEIGTPPGM